MHPIEKATIKLLKEQGYDFTPYLSVAPFLQPKDVGQVSDILDDEEEPGKEEE